MGEDVCCGLRIGNWETTSSINNKYVHPKKGNGYIMSVVVEITRGFGIIYCVWLNAVIIRPGAGPISPQIPDKNVFVKHSHR